MAQSRDTRNASGTALARIERLARTLGGIPVWAVPPGSSARQAGVRFADIILSVNGVPTPTFEDFLRAGRTQVAHVEFKVFRDGRVLKLRYEESDDA